MTDSSSTITLTKQAWDDLKDRLTLLVPRGINLGLQHRTYGNITLGEYPMTSTVEELPGFPEVEIVINGATDVINRSTIISLIEQLLSDVSETESLSEELVSVYADLAVLEELGRILPSCKDISDMALQTGNLIKQKISAMGCCLTYNAKHQWECEALWGGAIRVDLRDRDALQKCLDNRRPHIVDRGPLPNVLAADSETGSWCAIPMINEKRAEGLLVLARHDSQAFTSKDAKLLEIIASQMANYILKIRHQEELRHAEMLNHEVSIAGRIQKSMLPKAAPPVSGYQICGRLNTAEKVGGDYYDHIIKDDRLTLVVADVSGHSVPAALAMTMVRTALRASNSVIKNPADLVCSMNQQLSDDLAEAGLFVSLFIVTLDINTGTYQACCAGHPPMLLRKANGSVHGIDSEGMILGFSTEAAYEIRQGQLEPGACLLLYTDGITENLNPQREMFGEERLKQCFADAEADAEQVLNAVDHAMFQWSQGHRQDDCTMLCISRDR